MGKPEYHQSDTRFVDGVVLVAYQHPCPVELIYYKLLLHWSPRPRSVMDATFPTQFLRRWRRIDTQFSPQALKLPLR